jgi:hypothetical protein
MVTMRPEAFQRSLLRDAPAPATNSTVAASSSMSSSSATAAEEDVSLQLLSADSHEAFTYARVGRTLLRSQARRRIHVFRYHVVFACSRLSGTHLSGAPIFLSLSLRQY